MVYPICQPIAAKTYAGFGLSDLDSRDEPEFDGAWVRADEVVEKAKKSFAGAEALEAAATKLRQAVFMRCIRKLGSSDLAAYVSDDAGLLFDAMAMELSNKWIAGLLAAYREGKLPAGPGFGAAASGAREGEAGE